MNEETYDPEDWLELHDLIMRMEDSVEDQDFYEVERPELDMLKLAHRYIQTQLSIFTGKNITESPMTGEKYVVNIWIEKGNGLIHALSKRRIEDGET